jgi:hypothetical protein
VTTPAPERPVDVYRKYLRVHGVERSPLSDAIAEAFAELHPIVLPLVDATVLKIEPGDILVFTVDHPLSDAEHDFMMELIESQFPGHQCVVLEGAQLAVVRPAPTKIDT